MKFLLFRTMIYNRDYKKTLKQFPQMVSSKCDRFQYLESVSSRLFGQANWEFWELTTNTSGRECFACSVYNG